MSRKVKAALRVFVAEVPMLLFRVLCEPPEMVLADILEHPDEKASRPAGGVKKSQSCNFFWAFALKHFPNRLFDNVLHTYAGV